MTDRLRLFVWPAYSPDYSDGLAVAIAHDGDEARDLIAEKAGYRSDSLAVRPEVYELDAPVAFERAGGG